MRIALCAAAAAAALMLTAPAALGLVLDGQGVVTDWGITPLARPNQTDSYAATLWSTVSNNYSPIYYPNVGHVPSPGGADGEKCDLEELNIRYVGGQMQVLLVASSGLQASSGSTTFHLGDLFLTVNGQQYGIVTQQANSGLALGSIYRIDKPSDTTGLESGVGSWANSNTQVANDYGPDATVASIIGPWAVSDKVKSSQQVGSVALQSATHNYGGAEDGTYLLEYTLDQTMLGLDIGSIVIAQIAWGSGSDVIRLNDAVEPPTPEPSSFGLLAVGMAGALVVQHRVSRRRLVPLRIGN